VGIRLEARQPLVDVGNEAGLAHLAVVDDVDAQLGLLAHDVADRPPHAGGERVRVVRAARGLGLDELQQVGRAR